MNNSQTKDNEEGKATNHKSLTREELRNDRQLRRELRKRLKFGEDVSEELLACEGRIKVLEKELTAIEEGGHEVFLSAKETNSPKKNYPEKKKEVKSKIKDIENDISNLEHLISENQDDDTKLSSITKELSRLRISKEDLENEMKALLQYNHTQFIEIKEADKSQQDKDLELQNLEKEKEDQIELLEANENFNMQALKCSRINFHWSIKKSANLLYRKTHSWKSMTIVMVKILFLKDNLRITLLSLPNRWLILSFHH